MFERLHYAFPAGSSYLRIDLIVNKGFQPQPIDGFDKWVAYLKDPANRRIQGYLRVEGHGECCLGAKRTTEGCQWQPVDMKFNRTHTTFDDALIRMDSIDPYSYGSKTLGPMTRAQVRSGNYLGNCGLSRTGEFPEGVTVHLVAADGRLLKCGSLSDLNDKLDDDGSFAPVVWVIERVFCERKPVTSKGMHLDLAYGVGDQVWFLCDGKLCMRTVKAIDIWVGLEPGGRRSVRSMYAMTDNGVTITRSERELYPTMEALVKAMVDNADIPK